jgi:hypothetical protein
LPLALTLQVTLLIAAQLARNKFLAAFGGAKKDPPKALCDDIDTIPALIDDLGIAAIPVIFVNLCRRYVA